MVRIAESLLSPKFHYDKKRDILYIAVKEGEEIGIEIFNASKKVPKIE